EGERIRQQQEGSFVATEHAATGDEDLLVGVAEGLETNGLEVHVEAGCPQRHPRRVLDLAAAPEDRDGGRPPQHTRVEEESYRTGDVLECAGVRSCHE